MNYNLNFVSNNEIRTVNPLSARGSFCKACCSDPARPGSRKRQTRDVILSLFCFTIRCMARDVILALAFHNSVHDSRCNFGLPPLHKFKLWSATVTSTPLGPRFVDFNLRRIWHGFEHFEIQLGVDSDSAVESIYPSLQTHFLDAPLRHMAGDGFALPAFAVFFLAIIYSLHKEEVESLV